MTTYKPGDIILVPFPFTNLAKLKKRPALIMLDVEFSKKDQLYTVAMITSQMENDNIIGDVKIKQWQKSGLLNQSKVRLTKMVTLESRLILKKLGTLHPDDALTIGAAFKKLFKFWIN